MFLIDNINKCTIFNSTLFDDLQPYSLVDNNNKLYIDYNLSTIEFNTRFIPTANAKEISIEFDAINSLIQKSAFWSRKSTLIDTWLPVFINTNNNKIKNKLLTRGGSIEKTQLGIEYFISFEPKFKNWTLNNTTTKMTTDWIINSSLIPFNPQYGLLFWIKYSPESSITSLKSNIYKSIESFPIGSRLKSNNSTWEKDHFIKISEDQLLIINQDDSLVTGTKNIFQIGSNVIYISKLGIDTKFILVKPDSDKFIGTNESIELWIPDGDFYTYLEDEELIYNSDQSSKSYISPCLYNKYIQIYHILTLNDIKYLNSKKSIIRSRSLKRLSYALATSPLLDNVCHNYLNNSNITTIVDKYLNNILYDNISTEQNKLENCLIDIFLELKFLNEKLNKKTLNNNYVTSRKELFKKLTNKYSSNLTIAGTSCEIRYNNKLKHGDHILINQSINSYCPISIPSGTIVYNNQDILLNNISISTVIDDKKSEINLNNTKILPLTDIIKEIPKDLVFSIGPDQLINYDSSNDSEEIAIELEGVEGLSYNRNINYTWEQISGPCLRFSDYNKDSFRQIRYTYSTDSTPLIYTYGPGIYKIKCTIVTDIGVTSDTKTIYVLRKNTPRPTLKPATKVKMITGGLKVICPNLNTIAINKRGIFWPIKTDLYIGRYGGIYEDQFIRLQGEEKFVFPIDKNKISYKDSTLKLTYNPNNTIIKLNRYILQNMRNETEECSQCRSFYRELVISDAPTYARRLRYPDSIILPRYFINNNLISKIADITFSYPEISTKYAPPIKTYGGYGEIDKNINNINNIQIPFSTDVTGVIPNITGHNLKYENKICFEKPEIEKELADYQDNNFIINAKKGSFIPSSGFLEKEFVIVTGIENTVTKLQNPYINKSSILKFNPGAKKQFVFKGAGFKNLIPSLSGNYIVPKIYKSTIQLSIDSQIIPKSCPEGASEKEIKECNSQNQKKELKDHDINHGYRYLNNGLYNIESDEFSYDNSSFIKNNPNCDGAVSSYSFCSLGPKKISTSTTEVELQDVVVPSFTIQDLSVKLNFLNYVNTKNLIVWLDVDVSALEASAINGTDGNPRCQLKNGTSPDPYCGSDYSSLFRNKFNNNNLITYLSNLGNMNYDANNRAKIRLYLLNQEHIQNNTYNFSVEFSDKAPKENKTHNFFIGSGFVHKQNIISNNDKLLPTTMSSGYSDNDHIIYRNILDNYTLDASFNNNRFTKFINYSLFNGLNNSDGNTKFTLNIAVVDESDEMRIYDNINNNEILTGLKTSINKYESSDIYNSLCSWEISINTSDKEPINIEKNNILNLIEYDNNPSYPGYTFLLDLGYSVEATNPTTNFSKINRLKRLMKKTKIPLINQNSPHTFLNNTNLCRFQDFESLNQLLFKSIEFPTQALLSIISATLTTIGIIGSTGATGAAGLAGALDELVAPGYRLLSNYFSDRRRQQTIEEISRFFDKADYSGYPFGSPEKILISATKNNNIWYKMEATIFKLNNLPILKRNKYKFIRIDKNSVEKFSKFQFDIIVDKQDIIDQEFIQKFVTVVADKEIALSGYITINNITIKDHDIVDVTAQKDKTTNGLYTIHNGLWYKLPQGLDRNNKLSQYYQWSLGGSKSLINNIDNLIKNKKLILIEGRLAYDLSHGFISTNGTIECYNNKTTTIDRQIINSALIIKNNKFYTILELNNPPLINNSILSYFSPKNRTLLVFKNDYTTKSTDIPLNKWSLEKTQQSTSTPENTISRFGIGSYGDGNFLVQKDLLSKNDNHIKLSNIIDQFNDNKIISKINCNINYIDKDINTIINYNGLKASVVCLNLDYKNKIFTDNVLSFEDNLPENISKELKNSIVDIQQTNTNCFYIYMPDLTTTPQYGEIEFANDLVYANSVLYESSDVYSNIQKRLKELQSETNLESFNDFGNPSQNFKILINGSIKDIEKHYAALKPDPERCYNGSYRDCYKTNTLNTIYRRYAEKNQLLSYIEERSNSVIAQSGIFPYKSMSMSWDNNIIESNNSKLDNHYIINIDPKQECSIDTDMTVKVLKKIIYRCLPIVGTIVDPDADNICPQSIKDFNSSDLDFVNKGDVYEYVFKDSEKIKETKYANITKWTEYIIERDFFINSGGPRDTLVRAQEYYDMAVDTSTPKNDGSIIKNRVYNVFNLDDVDNIKIKPKHIPRKLKGVDNHYDRYIPNKDGALVRLVNPSPGGSLHNEVRFWHCIDTKTKTETEPTTYLKAQNEMIYRAFFNSIDGIEHKSGFLESLYPWEWIPYEYDL